MKIFLIGFMGAGKTTLGKFAAKQNQLEFLDLDQMIEAQSGKEVREIFSSDGEDSFRELERQALHAAAFLLGDHLIACGGGTPCFFDNMDFMNNQGVTIYLDLSAARLTERLRNAPGKRPLINSLNMDLQTFVHHKLVERAGFYGQCNVIVEEREANKPGLSKIVGDILEGKI